MGSEAKNLFPMNRTKDKDGEEGGELYLTAINVTPVDNGWIVTSIFGEEELVDVEVFNEDAIVGGAKDMIQLIIDKLGLSDEIKITVKKELM